MPKIVYCSKSIVYPADFHHVYEDICRVANSCIEKSVSSRSDGTFDTLNVNALDKNFYSLEFTRVLNDSFSIHVYRCERKFIVFFINHYFITYQCYIAKTLNVIVDTLTRDFIIHVDKSHP